MYLNEKDLVSHLRRERIWRNLNKIHVIVPHVPHFIPPANRFDSIN